MTYIPTPTLGQLVLDTRGERWVVCFINRKEIGLMPTYDNPDFEMKVINRTIWQRAFRYQGWLMV